MEEDWRHQEEAAVGVRKRLVAMGAARCLLGEEEVVVAQTLAVEEVVEGHLH